jgi:hypothetical protein
MTETEMEQFVKKWLKRNNQKYRVESQVPILGKHRLDLVAYDKRSGVFSIVECKSTSEKSTMKRAFDQLVRYRDVISREPDEFIDRVSRKMEMRFSRWTQATDCGRRIRVEFLVGLRDGACAKTRYVREQKARYPSVGIIRCSNNGKCKLYVKDEAGAKHAKVCESKVETFSLKSHSALAQREHHPPKSTRRS